MQKREGKTMTVEVFNRRKKVESYLRRGVSSYHQIAAALGVKYETIRQDAHWIMRSWVKQQPRIVRYLRARAVATIEGVMMESLNSWELSKRDGEELTTITETCRECNGARKVKAGKGQRNCTTCQGTGSVKIERATIKGKVGDPQFLTVALNCVKEINKLHDLYPSEKRKREQDKPASIGVDLDGNPYLNLPIESLLEAKAFLSQLAAPKDTSVVIDSHVVDKDGKAH